jgi:hypothetical protein
VKKQLLLLFADVSLSGFLFFLFLFAVAAMLFAVRDGFEEF